jgi:hypothetical protein
MSWINDLADALGFGNNKQTDAAQQTLDDMLARANGVSAQNRGLIRDYYDQMNGTFSEGASKYNEAVASLADAIAHQGDYDKTVDDFLDPARNQRVQAAMDAINNAASASGQRFSSGYLDKLAAKQQALASEEWRSAYDSLMQDRQQQLQQAQMGVQNLGTMANIYGNDRNNLMQALSDYTSNMANQNNADLQMATDVMGQKANLDANRKGGFSAILDGIAPMVKAAAPFFGG